ncbi:Hsp20/alpha crystallin family protein [Mangrovivirga sp. M17]|uniref:Hsp20/alpha crystallin family protein n=1 Tax=Mangrovivirga halotolerans TaxID=2993936 RepID=A0ABT3RT16_9BACT|nr:Hsp20/alpha crystallin family protein [Mangrovivirga halotolerans]MCX2744636.1 Hsp20/alpha crystallin family protein [Mangrovivirga halotolerans]
MNTINGGSVQANVKFKRLKKNYRLIVNVPGISPEELNVDIFNDKLTVCKLTDTYESNVKVPKVHAIVTLPRDVDYQRIEAYGEDEKLVVNLPFNHDGRGYHKKIDVRQFPDSGLF